MKRPYAILALAAAALLCAPDISASRPVTGWYGLQLGRTHVQATYLSPLTYTGNEGGIWGEWEKTMPFAPEKAVMHFNTEAAFTRMVNPARTAYMVGLNGNFNWGLSWRKAFAPHWVLTAGGTVDLSGGAYYLLRNGNNPVQAMARAGVSARGTVGRTLTIGRLPVLLRDEVRIPLAGAFFCPGYGETYYEIYLGNHKGLCHLGWPGNNFGISNRLSATLDFGRTAMSLGYRLDYSSQWANRLNTRVLTNVFEIGIVPGGLGLKNRSPKAIHAAFSD